MFANTMSEFALFGKNAKRVKKDEKRQESFARREDGLEFCLDCWKRLMHGDSDRDLGVKTMRGLMGLKDAYGISSDEAQQTNDVKVGEATNAMINSLSTLHRWAISRSCSISTVWKFDKVDLLLTIEDAQDELEKKLQKNICTAIYF
jgi:hypothetical protein